MSGTDGENLQKFAEPDSRSLLAGSGLGVIQRGLALDWSRAPWTFCAGHGELNLASLTPGSSAYTRLYWPIPLPIFGAATRCRPVRPRSPSDGIELNFGCKEIPPRARRDLLGMLRTSFVFLHRRFSHIRSPYIKFDS
jgi:hypothetical protein